MRFHHANCEICRRDVFREEDVVSLTARSRETVDAPLAGQQPWSGIRTVCVPCARVIRDILNGQGG